MHYTHISIYYEFINHFVMKTLHLFGLFVNTRPARALLILLLLILSGGPARAQMDGGSITRDLNAAVARGASPATLWNIGYKIFNANPPTRELARALYQSYRGVQGETPEQTRALQHGAFYWGNLYRNWKNKRTVATQGVRRDFPYRRRGGEWESTLGLKRPEGGGPVIVPR